MGDPMSGPSGEPADGQVDGLLRWLAAAKPGGLVRRQAGGLTCELM